MDIARPSRARQRLLRRLATGFGSAALLLLGTLYLFRLEPAAPKVDAATIWDDTVERGELLRQVRGPGTLVPTNVQVIAASHEARVERIVSLPGTEVEAHTVLIEMSNPELEQLALEAESELLAAEADYRVLEAQLDSELLNQEATAAEAASELSEARIRLEADERLAAEGLLPDLNLQLSRIRAAERTKRHEIEQRRVERNSSSIAAQLAAERNRLDQRRALSSLRIEQVEALLTKADMDGVLQEVMVEVGQRVTPGTVLARVAQPGLLKAELQIPETQAKDVRVGQKVAVDTRNGIVAGRLSRIDPAVRRGTVTVDVELLEALPEGARPDLSVDGTIEIERLEDVLSMGRPSYGQAHDTIGLFKISPDGETATRVRVTLGRSSVHRVEVVDGLSEGDRVILSDTSAWDDFPKIRLQ